MSVVTLLHSPFFDRRELTEECKHGWTGTGWLTEDLEKHDWFSERSSEFVPFDSRRAIVDIAIGRYEAGLISLGRAAEIAGLKYDTMLEELGKRGIVPYFGPSSIEEAEKRGKRLVASLKKLRRRS